jgi:peptidoglycan/LPS O-acetylase OafA/YrhL
MPQNTPLKGSSDRVIKYRPDIDGLRAVAVLSVILFHAFPKLLPGGYAGVDIFFVISGYLITGILLKELNVGTFSFARFYARRVRRIFPAMIAMIIPLIIYCRMVLFPDEFYKFGRIVAGSSLFVQNFLFWRDSGYFDIAALSKPLLHLWSLAVEEQFYMILPPLLLLFYRKALPMRHLLWGLFVASLIANLVMSYQNRVSDFFLTPYRMWEFLSGSILAEWQSRNTVNGENAPVRQAGFYGLFGVVLLVISFSLLSERQPYPGWRAMIPVAGSMLIMISGMKSWFNARILAHPTMVWIGLISYPLYLFHWPPLSILHLIKGDHADVAMICGALGVSFVLAIVTYQLIEKPIRFSRSKWTVPGLVATHTLIGLIGFLAWGGVIRPDYNTILEKFNVAIDDFKISKGLDQKGEIQIFTKTAGGCGNQTLFFGDSHILHYSARILDRVRSHPKSGRGCIFITSPGVMPVEGVVNDKFLAYKLLLPEFWKTVDSDQRIDRIVIGANWAGVYFSKDSEYTIKGIPLNQSAGEDCALTELTRMIRELVRRGIKVYVILNEPFGRELDPKQYYKRNFSANFAKSSEVLTEKSFRSSVYELNRKIISRASAAGAIIIDPTSQFVMNGNCIVENEDGPIRSDSNHLRPTYVRKYVTYLDGLIEDGDPVIPGTLSK